jgi:hypothetical protein
MHIPKVFPEYIIAANNEGVEALPIFLQAFTNKQDRYNQDEDFNNKE